jgi:hypothetical protein
MREPSLVKIVRAEWDGKVTWLLRFMRKTKIGYAVEREIKKDSRVAVLFTLSNG